MQAITASGIMDNEARFTIGAVSQRTRLSPHVIRAWERRYGVVSPVRTEGGTRLYSNADILRLRLLRRATESGYSIGRAQSLTLAELVALTSEPVEEDDATDFPPPSRFAQIETTVLTAIEAMDGARVHAELRRGSALLGARTFVTRIAIPLLERVGELWEESTICPAQEHLLSVGLQRELALLLEALQGSHGSRSLVAATLSGEHHELGALCTAVMAAAEGWRVTYPGPNLPPDDIALTARRTEADVVLISSILPDGAGSLPEQVQRLIAALPEGVAVIVGGAGAASHADALAQAGAVYLSDVGQLPEEIEGSERASTALHLPPKRTF